METSRLEWEDKYKTSEDKVPMSSYNRYYRGGYKTPIKTPQQKYGNHKVSAKSRGIPFNLTFEEWWSLWEPHWEFRGSQAHELVMCR